MMTNFEMVKEFHTAFGHPDPEKIVIPGDKLQRLRLELISEELKEVIAEFGYEAELLVQKKNDQDIDMSRVAKELADLLYVVYGAAANFGIPMDKVFAEVHRSNMSKLGSDGKPILREDGKFLKGSNYKPADIKRVLNVP